MKDQIFNIKQNHMSQMVRIITSLGEKSAVIRVLISQTKKKRRNTKDQNQNLNKLLFLPSRIAVHLHHHWTILLLEKTCAFRDNLVALEQFHFQNYKKWVWNNTKKHQIKCFWIFEEKNKNYQTNRINLRSILTHEAMDQKRAVIMKLNS